MLHQHNKRQRERSRPALAPIEPTKYTKIKPKPAPATNYCSISIGEKRKYTIGPLVKTKEVGRRRRENVKPSYLNDYNTDQVFNEEEDDNRVKVKETLVDLTNNAEPPHLVYIEEPVETTSTTSTSIVSSAPTSTTPGNGNNGSMSDVTTTNTTTTTNDNNGIALDGVVRVEAVHNITEDYVPIFTPTANDMMSDSYRSLQDDQPISDSVNDIFSDELFTGEFNLDSSG